MLQKLNNLYNQNHDEEIALIKQENLKLREEIDMIKTQIDDQEQRSRYVCLLIRGIDEGRRRYGHFNS